MRNIILTAAITGLAFSSCMHRSSDHFFNGHGKSTTISINNGFNNLKIEYAGEVIFNEEETAIESISDDGYVKFKNNRKKLFAESDGHGGVKYELYNGLSGIDINGNGKDLIADAVKTMVNHGVDAKGRVVRLYNKGGAGEVLNKVRDMESAYVKQIYLDYLLANVTLSVNEKVLVLQNIAATEGADYEKSQLLEKYAGQFSMPELSQAFFVAVKSIDGNYEKSQVIKAAIHTMTDKDNVKAILMASQSISGDYEKSVVLKELLQTTTGLTNESIPALVNAVADIDGNYEQTEVIKAILSRSDLDPGGYNACIELISKVDGNYEQSELLKLVAGKPITDQTTWIRLIEVAAKIDANYEKSTVLIAIAAKMPSDASVREVYTNAAKTIEAEYEYGETMKAIR